MEYYTISNRDILSYSVELDLKAPGRLEQFNKEREKALRRYLKMKDRIKKKLLIK